MTPHPDYYDEAKALWEKERSIKRKWALKQKKNIG